jgi:uncharacterized protein (TIGR03905 family)
MKTTFKTSGTCSKEINIEIEDGILKDVNFVRGCDGNAQGMAALLRGMEAGEVVKRLRGIQCRNGTSCPDQLAVALEEML